MINLLPPKLKNSYRFARRNQVLRRWIVALAFVLLGLGALGTYGILAIHQSTVSYNKQIASANARLQSDHITQVKQQVQNISGSLRLAVQVLSNEVLFSKLISQIGAVMPNGALLTGLTINQTSGGLNLAAATKDYVTATQVQVNLSAPGNGIFAKVDIVSINCSGQNVTDPAHPCVAQLRALFNTKNQFLFINQGTKP